MPPSSGKPASTLPTERQQRGRVDRTVMFPVAPPAEEVPQGYSEWLGDLKRRVQVERLHIVLTSNMAMVMLYWDLGLRILQKQERDGWGARVIDRLTVDLREAFPDMKGFSARNLKYMRAFAAAWPERATVQRTVAQLPWRHIIALLEKVKSQEERLWYAGKALASGWSRDVLALQIETRAHLRQGKAQNNFPATLPPLDSDLATQVFKDPYLFDFLGTAAPRQEAELQRGLMEHLQKFLLELGDQDYYLDLLFYHLKLPSIEALEAELAGEPRQPSGPGP